MRAQVSPHAADIVDRLTNAQAAPPQWLVLATSAVAAVFVGYRPAWRLARNVVTIAHEGGHALVALLVGRKLSGIRVHTDTSGVTVSRGKPYGLGMIATTMAGYPTPPLLGLAFAALLAANRITLLLWLSIVFLAAMLLKIRNVWGAVTVIATGAALFAVSWFGTAPQQAALAYLGTWFLLFAGARPVLELARSRRHSQGSDADQLAGLTRLPGLFWIGVFGVIAVGSLVCGAVLLAHAAGVPLHLPATAPAPSR